MSKKEHALGIIPDLISNYFYYDRKEDEDLSVSDMESLIHDKELTVDELTDAFRQALVKVM